MNTDVLFSSKKDDWETPIDLFNKLDEEFHFTLDPAASKTNHKCKKFYTKEQDGLIQDWGGETVFVNPPYGGKVVNLWVAKAYTESLKPNTTVVMLLPSRTDTKWFHEYVLDKAEIRFIRKRLKFGNAVNPAPFPSIIVIFRNEGNFYGK